MLLFIDLLCHLPLRFLLLWAFFAVSLRATTQINLLKGKITHQEPIQAYLKKQGKTADFTNEVQVIIFEGGGKGVFKPDPEQNEMCAEVAAYRASEFFGLNIVPVTVIRKINSKIGCLQAFVESASVDDFDQAYQKVSVMRRADCEAFQFVFGRWDKGPDNHLLIKNNDDTYDVMLIDNASMAQRQQVKIGTPAFICYNYYDRRKDNWSVPFPFDKIQTVSYNDILNHPDFKLLNLPKSAFKFLQKTNRTLHYVFWRNCLWFQPYTGSPYVPTLLSPSFMEKLKSLTHKDIASFWRDAPKEWTKKRKDEMIQAVLDRRDQLMNYFNSKPQH